MQSRVNDVTINEIPKFLAANPTNETHSIIVTDTDDWAQQVFLHLDMIEYRRAMKNKSSEWLD